MSERTAAAKSGASRRRFLKRASVGAAAAAAAVAMPQVSRAQTATLRMQGSWGAKDILSDMAREYIDRVEGMAGGRLKIDYLPAGAVVKSFQVQDATHKGVLDGAHTVTTYWFGKSKAAALFGTGPVFGANGSQILAWIHRGGGKELYRELVQDVLGLNLVGFFAMPMPAQPLGWFQKKINSIADLKELKYSTAGLATDIMRGIGTNVAQLPTREIMLALDRGVIEAFEFSNPTTDRQIGAQEVSKFYHMGSFHQAIEFFEIIFNKSRYDLLPAEHQNILEYSAEAASTANYAMAMDRFSGDLRKLIEEDGVKVYRTDPSVMAAQLESWDKVLDELMKDPFFAKVLDSQKEWARRVAYYDLMNAADYKLAFEHYFPGEIDF